MELIFLSELFPYEGPAHRAHNIVSSKQDQQPQSQSHHPKASDIRPTNIYKLKVVEVEVAMSQIEDELTKWWGSQIQNAN